MRGFLGRSREERSESDIVRARFARFHREVAAVVAGHADLCVLAENFAGFARVAVVLTEMNAVCAQALGEANAVVDDERHVSIGAHPLKWRSQRRNSMVVDALQPKLEGGNRPITERPDELLGKGGVDNWRRNQIKLTRGPPLTRKTLAEIGTERRQIVFVIQGVGDYSSPL